jgi:mono/diheme cytochrome c family protein
MIAVRAHAIVLSALLGGTTLMPARAIDIQDFDLIQRGKYLADLGDCSGCHTLPGSGAGRVRSRVMIIAR